MTQLLHPGNDVLTSRRAATLRLVQQACAGAFRAKARAAVSLRSDYDEPIEVITMAVMRTPRRAAAEAGPHLVQRSENTRAILEGSQA